MTRTKKLTKKPEEMTYVADRLPDGAAAVIRVHFEDEEAVTAFAALLDLNITKDTKEVWWSRDGKRPRTGLMRYVDG